MSTPSTYATWTTLDADIASVPISAMIFDERVPGREYITAQGFSDKHKKQFIPPKGGWVHGSRVMCGMRQKDSGEYFPRVLCYVYIENNHVYLIQKCCNGTYPDNFPKEYAHKGYKSWTLAEGSPDDMLNENVAYLGPNEGRNKL